MKLEEKIKDLRKCGIYCRQEYIITSKGYKLQWSVHHPLSKLKKKFTMQEVETYYDRYIALESVQDGTININFHEWFMLTVYEENKNDKTTKI